MQKELRKISEIIYQAAKNQGIADMILGDFEIVSRITEENPELKGYLNNSHVNFSEKAKQTDKIFKIHGESKAIINLLIENNYFRHLDEIIKQLIKLNKQEGNITEIIAETVIPLDESQQKRIIETMSEKTGRNISLNNQLSENLIGGLVIRIEDNKVIDLSIRGRLQQLKKFIH